MPKRIGIEVKREDSDLERTWDFNRLVLAPDLPAPKCNYRFDVVDGTGLEFDRAFTNERVAVEIQGATWRRGAHSTGRGLNRDYRKANLAAANGWTLLYADGDMLRKNPQEHFRLLKLAIAQREN